MKHRERADEQDEVDDEREVRNKPGNFVVNCNADERDREPNQAGQNARAD